MRPLDVPREAATWARKYLVPPRYRREERLRLVADDGTRLAAARLEGPPSTPLTVVLLHGFSGSSRLPVMHAFARRLASEVNVVVPDLRGHGQSKGRCTLGRQEARDVAAAVAAAPPGFPVVTVGVSLGAAAAILHAGTYGGVAGTVALSGPGWWGPFDREGAIRVEQMTARATGRALLAALLRTRVATGEQVATGDGGAIEAQDVVAAIAPAFMLMVHDPDDRYFGPEHPEHLYRCAQEPKDLWWVPGAGHGTDLLTPELADRLLPEVIGAVRSNAGARAPGGARAPELALPA
ncbi:MAG TPA: alpha/beta hydrolase [Acidimicrobiales bacterium]|nr:alpha/beta hydrolase [Acidimicrobiales bacterium]